MRSFGRNRRLGFEGLERRELLTGNVNAGLDVNGNLVLSGDLSANAVVVYRGAFGRMFVQGGRITANDANTRTTVNGQFTGVGFDTSGGITLNMSDGNDKVLITNFDIQGNITGFCGVGNDTVALQSSSAGAVSFTTNDLSAVPYGKVSVSGLVNINGGDGNDVISLSDATIGGAFTFTGGNGNDQYIDTGSSHTANTIGGTVTLTMGSGDDTIAMTRRAIGGYLNIDDGDALTKSTVQLVSTRVNLDVTMNLSIKRDFLVMRGEDNSTGRFQARDVNISTGDGNDYVQVYDGIMVNLKVDTGAGDERNGTTDFGVKLLNLAINTQLFLDTGVGNDWAYVNNVNTTYVRIYTQTGVDRLIVNHINANDGLVDTGSENDFAGLHDSQYAILAVMLGDGNDIFEARALNVTSRTTLDGGLGANTYRDQGGNSFANLTRTNI
jgi:hypothetical protein